MTPPLSPAELEERLARVRLLVLDVDGVLTDGRLLLGDTGVEYKAFNTRDGLGIKLLLEARGFGPDDFARSHPGGRLGRRLLLHISDVMHGGEGIPRVAREECLAEALVEMTRKSLGMVFIVDADQGLLGVFTDGDLRRALEREVDARRTPMEQVMTAGCVSVRPHALAAEGLKLMQDRKVNGLAVVDEREALIGALNMHDLLRAGVL